MNDRQRLEEIVAVVCKYLPPDGISREEAMSEIIGLIDPLPEEIRLDEAKGCARQYLSIMRDAVEQTRADEREACAKLCDDLLDGKDRGRGYWSDGVRDAQDAIRQRGEK